MREATKGGAEQQMGKRTLEETWGRTTVIIRRRREARIKTPFHGPGDLRAGIMISLIMSPRERADRFAARRRRGGSGTASSSRRYPPLISTSRATGARTMPGGRPDIILRLSRARSTVTVYFSRRDAAVSLNPRDSAPLSRSTVTSPKTLEIPSLARSREVRHVAARNDRSPSQCRRCIATAARGGPNPRLKLELSSRYYGC